MRWLVGRSLFLALSGVVAGSGLLAPLAGWGQVPVAQAGEQWCEYDPIRLLYDDAGRRLPVAIFYTPGAQISRPRDATRMLSLLTGTLLRVSTSTQRVAGGTKVTLRVTVPNDAFFGTGFPTRLKVTADPLGTLTVYGTATGTSGTAMTVKFLLPSS